MFNFSYILGLVDNLYTYIVGDNSVLKKKLEIIETNQQIILDFVKNHAKTS